MVKYSFATTAVGPFLGDKVNGKGAVRMSTRMVFHIPKASKESLCHCIVN